MSLFIMDPERQEAAVKIVAHPERYKICEGCDSIITAQSNICPNCHSYRFETDRHLVIEQAQALSIRPAESVTPDDLQ